MAKFAENKKAYFNYEILEKITAGIELFGFEVKSIRAGQASLDGAHVIVRGGEAFLMNVNITPLQPKNLKEFYDPRRNRRLLLNKKEISGLAKAEGRNGLTIVPLELYNTGNLIKVLVGVVRGKRKFDKRESIKKRESDRDISRTLKNE